MVVVVMGVGSDGDGLAQKVDGWIEV